MKWRNRLCQVAIVVAGLFLLLAPSTGAQDIDSGAQVKPDPPTTAAKILKPTNGQRFSKALITVSGTCPGDVTVEIYKNAIFAGSTPCVNNVFSLQISLVPGRNRLIAKVRDAADQYGPNSKPVVVYLDSKTGVSTNPGAGVAEQPLALIVTTDAIYRGGKVNVELPIRIKIAGGVAPYALSVDWESGQRSLVSRSMSGSFIATHTYRQPGTYQIKIQAVDESAQSAFVQTVAVIDGQPPEPTHTPADKLTRQPTLNTLINLLGLIILAALAFWLGHKYSDYRRRQRFEPPATGNPADNQN